MAEIRLSIVFRQELFYYSVVGFKLDKSWYCITDKEEANLQDEISEIRLEPRPTSDPNDPLVSEYDTFLQHFLILSL